MIEFICQPLKSLILNACINFSSHTVLGSLIVKWEYTMWKFQDISATHILCEINFDHFEGPKTAILTIWPALNFEFLGNF